MGHICLMRARGRLGFGVKQEGSVWSCWGDSPAQGEAWASRLPHSSSLSLSQVIASGTQEACPARVLPQRRGEARQREARRGQGRAALGRPGGTVAGIWAPTQTISGLAARAGSR